MKIGSSGMKPFLSRDDFEIGQKVIGIVEDAKIIDTDFRTGQLVLEMSVKELPKVSKEIEEKYKDGFMFSLNYTNQKRLIDLGFDDTDKLRGRYIVLEKDAYKVESKKLGRTTEVIGFRIKEVGN